MLISMLVLWLAVAPLCLVVIALLMRRQVVRACSPQQPVRASSELVPVLRTPLRGQSLLCRSAATGNRRGTPAYDHNPRRRIT